MTSSCSVYELSFPDGKKYIGVSSNVSVRWKAHCCNAFQKSLNHTVYRAMRRFGKESVVLKILLAGSSEYCAELERKIISSWDTIYPNGYNKFQGGDLGPMYGKKHSEESRAKMATYWKGKHVGEDNPASKLSKDDIDEIRRLRGEGMTQRAIAGIFGVSQSTVCGALHKITEA